MRILTIDTATRRATVAALDDDRLVASAVHEKRLEHAERILLMVDEVVSQARWKAPDLLAVGMGPGSFTGVRVGMATAKGLGMALRVPAVGVVSLEAMAWQARHQAGAQPVVTLLDAKKNEVFAAVYGAAGQELAAPCHLGRQAVDQWLASNAPAGASIVGEVAGQLGLTSAWLRGEACDLPGPAAMAALAITRWQQNERDELTWLEPLYVRPPDVTYPAGARPQEAGA